MNYPLLFVGAFNVLSVAIVIWILIKLESRVNNLEKIVSSEDTQKNVSETQITDEEKISLDLYKGLRRVKDDDQKHLSMLEMSRKIQSSPTPITNHTQYSKEIIDTAGDLLPDNLTKEELDVIKAFYDPR